MLFLNNKILHDLRRDLELGGYCRKKQEQQQQQKLSICLHFKIPTFFFWFSFSEYSSKQFTIKRITYNIIF